MIYQYATAEADRVIGWAVDIALAADRATGKSRPEH